MPEIYIMKGPDKGHSFEIGRDVTTIGRGPGADISLGDKTVSRKHAQIMNRRNKYILKDLGSKNGTFIDGRRIMAETSHEIRKDDRIAIGDTVFSVGKPFEDVVKDSLDSIDLFEVPNGQEAGTTLDVMKRGRPSRNGDDPK